MDLDKHIWEGWLVRDFIISLQQHNPPQFKTRNECKRWCMNNQPYYKKYVKDVVDYMWDKYKFNNDTNN